MKLPKFAVREQVCPFCKRGLTIINDVNHGPNSFHFDIEAQCSYCCFTDIVDKAFISCFYIRAQEGYTLYRFIVGTLKLNIYIDEHDAYIVINKYRTLDSIEVEYRKLSFDDPVALQNELKLILAFH